MYVTDCCFNGYFSGFKGQNQFLAHLQGGEEGLCATRWHPCYVSGWSVTGTALKVERNTVRCATNRKRHYLYTMEMSWNVFLVFKYLVFFIVDKVLLSQSLGTLLL